MRARPRRGPTTAPAIQALEVLLLLVSEPFADDDGTGIENAVCVSVRRRFGEG